MSILAIFTNNKHKPAPELIDRLNSDLNLCGFNEEIKHGFLFFLGASLPAVLPICRFGCVNDEETTLKILNSYASIKINKPNLGNLDKARINTLFRTAELILPHEANNNDTTPKPVLSESANDSANCLFDKAIFDLQRQYEDIVLKIEPLTNFYDDFFQILGKYLLSAKYSYQASYQAGVSYYHLSQDLFMKQFVHILRNLQSILPPIYDSLFYLPIIFNLQYKQYKSNHLFSTTFYFFSNGIDENILNPIHKWHQIVFYKPVGVELREEWTFEINASQMTKVFWAAIDIRKQFPNLISQYKKYNGLAMPELLDQKRSELELYNDMVQVIYKKYKISATPQAWNHKGEFIQFLAILFYESCLHAMVLSEIIEGKK